MALVKFNNTPLRTFNSIFDEILHDFPAAWTTNGNGNGWATPAVNVHETNEAYHLEVNAPGLQKEDFTIRIDNDQLVISYERKEEKKSEDYRTLRKEFSFRSFKRSFNLDNKVDAENIQARYENGLLKLLLPKKGEAKPEVKQISIQ